MLRISFNFWISRFSRSIKKLLTWSICFYFVFFPFGILLCEEENLEDLLASSVDEEIAKNTDDEGVPFLQSLSSDQEDQDAIPSCYFCDAHLCPYCGGCHDSACGFSRECPIEKDVVKGNEDILNDILNSAAKEDFYAYNYNGYNGRGALRASRRGELKCYSCGMVLCRYCGECHSRRCNYARPLCAWRSAMLDQEYEFSPTSQHDMQSDYIAYNSRPSSIMVRGNAPRVTMGTRRRYGGVQPGSRSIIGDPSSDDESFDMFLSALYLAPRDCTFYHYAGKGTITDYELARGRVHVWQAFPRFGFDIKTKCIRLLVYSGYFKDSIRNDDEEDPDIIFPIKLPIKIAVGPLNKYAAHSTYINYGIVEWAMETVSGGPIVQRYGARIVWYSVRSKSYYGFNADNIFQTVSQQSSMGAFGPFFEVLGKSKKCRCFHLFAKAGSSIGIAPYSSRVGVHQDDEIVADVKRSWGMLRAFDFRDSDVRTTPNKGLFRSGWAIAASFEMGLGIGFMMYDRIIMELAFDMNLVSVPALMCGGRYWLGPSTILVGVDGFRLTAGFNF